MESYLNIYKIRSPPPPYLEQHRHVFLTVTALTYAEHPEYWFIEMRGLEESINSAKTNRLGKQHGPRFLRVEIEQD